MYWLRLFKAVAGQIFGPERTGYLTGCRSNILCSIKTLSPRLYLKTIYLSCLKLVYLLVCRLLLLTWVNQLCVKEWQQLWNQCTSNKLYSVQPVVGRSVSSSLGLYDSVLINPSSNWSYKTYKLVSLKGRESTGVKLAILCSQSSTSW